MVKKFSGMIAVGVAVALTLGFLAVTNVTGVWAIPELWSQIFAACTGALVVAVVTMVLMRGQRAAEEEKEKGIKIYENKVEAYSRFVTKMYKLLSDERISCDDFLNLRMDIFNSLIFYLEDDHLRLILREVEGIDDFQNVDEMIHSFARITNILQDDLAGRTYKPDDKERVLVSLWKRFGAMASACPLPADKADTK
ncbi:MAG: ammonium transporter [Bacteroidales bacterium]|nr:ammonium transporter [Bacteroidales bacterium]